MTTLHRIRVALVGAPIANRRKQSACVRFQFHFNRLAGNNCPTTVVMAPVDLNKTYKPSAWNPQLSPDEVIQRYLRIAEECKSSNQTKLRHQLNVPYGDRPGMTFDIYEKPDLPKHSPIFVFIHGGYWQESSKDGNTFMVQTLAEAGFRVFLIGYDLCPNVTLSELHEEVQVALATILFAAEEKYGSGEVVLCGHSAGACLAMAMLTRRRWTSLPNSHLIRAVYLLGGIYDLTEARFADVVNKDNLLGITDENVSELSPFQEDYSHLAEERVLVSVIVAEFDAPGLVNQGNEMAVKLNEQGAHSEILVAKAFDHFELVTELRHSNNFVIERVKDVCARD